MGGSLAGLLLTSTLALGQARPTPTGQWQVLTVPAEAGAGPACMLTTADPANPASNPTRWSLRYRPGELSVIENSIGIGDATIPTLTLSIGLEDFGPLPITERSRAPDSAPAVVAYVSGIATITGTATVARAVAALQPGNAIRITRRGRGFLQQLDAAAATAFAACRDALPR